MYDIVVVGSGFSGSVLAERFANEGRKVLVVEKRDHIAGNAYDHYDQNGILIHEYGAHIFHTNDETVFHYLSNFTEWRIYQHKALAFADGQFVPLPINKKTIEMLYGPDAVKEGVGVFLDKVKQKIENPKNAEENVLSRIGDELYKKFFKGYTEKQWGRSAKELRPSVTARIPVRENYDDRYFTDKYQVMPSNGYTELFRKMLSDEKINIMLKTNWNEIKDSIPYKKLIYTGPIDEYFNHKYGKLAYRSLKFKYKLYFREYMQPVAGIKYSSNYDFTRTIEFKHLTGQKHPFTVVSEEYPTDEGEPYYPVPADDTEIIYRKYKKEAENLDDVKFVGRLATYRYYNMDQAVAAALSEFEKLKSIGW